MASVLAVLLAAPAGANYTEGVRIAMRTVNNSPTHLTVSYCPRGHVSISYKFGTRADPCNVITERNFPSPNGGRHTYTSNPFGLIISASGFKTIYFYARNPSVGKPFIEVNGHSYHMFAGQLTTVHTHGATIRLHREGDRNDLKQMTIEVIHLAKA